MLLPNLKKFNVLVIPDSICGDQHLELEVKEDSSQSKYTFKAKPKAGKAFLVEFTLVLEPNPHKADQALKLHGEYSLKYPQDGIESSGAIRGQMEDQKINLFPSTYASSPGWFLAQKN